MSFLNRQEKDILCFCMKNRFRNQRELAKQTGYSLGTANQALKNLISDKWLTREFLPTNAARELLESNRLRRGIILAAGLGMRMVPINTQTTKGLLEVKGECLIERLICQLHQAGVFEITVVVGFMKEQYEYLIDKYQVNLVVNTCYGQRNNLYSMSLVLDKLEDAYVIPCDLWCEENPFYVGNMRGSRTLMWILRCLQCTQLPLDLCFMCGEGTGRNFPRHVGRSWGIG